MKVNWPAVGGFAQAAWRPFMGYGGAVSLFVGLFSPAVTVEKMGVIAALLGTLGYFRTQDKKTEINAAVAQGAPLPPVSGVPT